MAARSLPIVLPLLRDEPNAASDAALLDAIPELDSPIRKEALAILIHRRHEPTLAQLVGRFEQFEAPLQDLILDHVDVLFPVVKIALESETQQQRLGAIEFIRRAEASSLAPLLVDSLRRPCPLTRDRAAGALHTLTAGLLARARSCAGPKRTDVTIRQLDTLAAALRDAVVGWELHFQPQAIEAAMWMARYIEPAFWQTLQNPRGQLAPLLSGLMRGSTDPRMIPFLLRVLALPSLGDVAVSVICRAHDSEWIRAFVAECGPCDDPSLVQGLLRLRDCPWLHHHVDDFLVAAKNQADKAVRVLLASGGPAARKTAMMRSLLNSDETPIIRAILNHLLQDAGEASNELLSLLAARRQDEFGQSAALELRRRAAAPPAAGHTSRTSTSALSSSRATATEGDPPHRAILGHLASDHSLDRLTGLRMIRDHHAHRELSEHVYKLTHDPDAVVRSFAVGLLSDLPGATSERILRAAVNDPDERVQANAVEVLDKLNVSDRAEGTVQKLSSHNNRVRANAVKSLLRLELRHAAEHLLNMLADSRSDHRRSALWVVERLQLRSVLGRVRRMSRDDPDERLRQRAAQISREFDDVPPLSSERGTPPEPLAAGRRPSHPRPGDHGA
jgi:HEAT repeat protein